MAAPAGLLFGYVADRVGARVQLLGLLVGLAETASLLTYWVAEYPRIPDYGLELLPSDRFESQGADLRKYRVPTLCRAAIQEGDEDPAGRFGVWRW